MRQPLVDCDVLLYEVGFGVESGWDSPGYPPFDKAMEMIDMRIANICALAEADSPPILYLTGKGNFRNGIAVTKPYKERLGNKPFHYYNLKAYVKAVYDTRWQDGLEADDLMAIEQTSRPFETIICTRDKDLRQVPGWHYGWELGNQPSFGPLLVDELGKIELGKKITGYGSLFFYSQCLTGDGVDTVPGLKGCGPVKAFKILEGSASINEAHNRVLEAYKAVYEGSAPDVLLEQGQLLWMTRKLNEDGSPVLWRFPE